MKQTKTIRWAQWMFMATLSGLTQDCERSLEDLPCPCSNGWTCCATDHICYRSALSCPNSAGAGTTMATSSDSGSSAAGTASLGAGGTASLG
ncbi:MAG TPA: hypothetical protein VIV60_12745, partial [Polyangiaceae bacterium]